MKKRILALAMVSSLCLAACGQSAGPPDQGGAQSKVKSESGTETTAEGAAAGQTKKAGELNVLFMSGVYADSARTLTDDFKAETGYDVVVSDVPFASFHETAMLDFASQAGSYDVVAVNLSWLGEFAPHLEPLDDRVKESGMEVEGFIPSVLDACKWDGVLYGFPKAPTPNMMAYRTDLIDTPPATYEEYMKMAAQFNDPDNGMYGISIPGKKEQYAVLYLVRSWAMGADVADQDWNVIVNGDIGRKAMEQLGEVTKYSDPAGLSWGLEESINAFLQGKAAFCEAWPTLGIVQAADDPEKSKIVDKWAIAPFPPEKTGINQMSIWCVAVSKYSKNKDAAFQWIKEYSSKENQEKFYEDFGILPSYTSFWEREDVKNSKMGPLGEGLKTSVPKWRIPVSAELDSIMANAVSSYMSKQMTLDEAMDFFDSELNRAIKNNPPPEGSKNDNAAAVEKALQ